MFERITQPARIVITLAQEEALRTHHDAVGTGHILLALIRQSDPEIRKILDSLNVSAERVRRDVEGIIGRGELIQGKDVMFNPRSKKVLEDALHECRRLRHRAMRPQHLLLGLLLAGGIAGEVLASLGVSLERIRETLKAA